MWPTITRRARSARCRGPLLLAIAVASAACTGSGEDEAQPEPTPLTGPAAVVEELGCRETVNIDPSGIGATAAYNCNVGGDPVRLHLVEGDRSDALRRLSQRYGTNPDLPDEDQLLGFRVVDGDGWIAVTGTPEAARSIVEAVGGHIQPWTRGADGPPVSYPVPVLPR